MAFCTNRKNIKFMLRFVAQIMMIFIRWLKTEVALKRFGFRQLTNTGGVFNCIPCSYSHWESFSIFFYICTMIYLTNITFLVVGLVCLYFFCLLANPSKFYASFCFGIFQRVLTVAYFAGAFKAICPVFIFAKISKKFSFFAFSASFCYSWFRHGFFLTKKLCLEPVAAHTAVGSLYRQGYQRI